MDLGLDLFRVCKEALELKWGGGVPRAYIVDPWPWWVVQSTIGSGNFQGKHPAGARHPSSQNCSKRGSVEGRGKQGENRGPQGMLCT